MYKASYPGKRVTEILPVILKSAKYRIQQLLRDGCAVLISAITVNKKNAECLPTWIRK